MKLRYDINSRWNRYNQRWEYDVRLHDESVEVAHDTAIHIFTAKRKVRKLAKAYKKDQRKRNTKIGGHVEV